MKNVMRMYSSKHWRAFDLEDDAGRKFDRTMEIESVDKTEIIGDGGKKDDKPTVRFKGEAKYLILNKTNVKIMIAMLGRDGEQWPGKRITIYSTTAKMGGKTVDSVGVRPMAPTDAATTATDPPAPLGVAASAAIEWIDKMPDGSAPSDLAAYLTSIKDDMAALSDRDRNAVRSRAATKMAWFQNGGA